MKTHLDCLPCVMSQALQALRKTTKNEVTIGDGLRKVASRLVEYKTNESPPIIVRDIHRIIREVTGSKDPYREIKEHSTALALQWEDWARSLSKKSFNSFDMAVKIAIAGNSMDYALMSNWDEKKLSEAFEHLKHVQLNILAVEELRQKSLKAEWILFLSDNVGETVFDKLLLEECLGPKMYYAVKSSPVINDATKEDAIAAGIDDYATIIENGSDAPGTVLEDCSEEFMNLYNTAPLIIAKGQANFETLNDASREIFFLTQIKCPVISELYGYELGHWLVTSSTKLRKDRLQFLSNQ